MDVRTCVYVSGSVVGDAEDVRDGGLEREAAKPKRSSVDRVASRFILTGSNRGRSVRLWGITISRLGDGRIVEDYSAFDSLELFKQLGLWRTLLAAPALVRALGDGRPG